jgi:cyanophycinase
MSTTMFRDPPEVLAIGKSGLKEVKEIERGVGVARPDLFVDQRFLKRGSMPPAMARKGNEPDLGVEENSSAIILGDEIEVIGSRGTLLADLGEADRNSVLADFNLQNAKLTYLDRGDRYNLKTKQLTPSATTLAAQKIDPRAADFKPLFGRCVLRRYPR